MASFADLPSCAEMTERPDGSAPSLRWLVIAAMVSSLSGCGGGSAAAPEPPPPAPVPSPAPSPTPTAPIAAQLTVPTPVGYDADRLAAFNRLNEIRLSAGLGMVAQQTQMDQAAQAHAEWMIANDAFTHEELEGTPGFTGVNFAERDEFFGYVPMDGGEVISAPVHGAEGVNSLMNTVYHRSILMAFEPVDLGLGWSMTAALNVSMPLVIDLALPGTDPKRGVGQTSQPSINGVAIWPLDGSVNVPLLLGRESPNPVPAVDVLTLGTPVSIIVAESKTISATSFVMKNAASGAVVSTQILTSQSDPNSFIPSSFIAAVPLAPLAPATTYTVLFAGNTLEPSSGSIVSINKTWSFTTGNQ